MGMKFLPALVLLAFAATARGTGEKETMCVKQNNGTYKCMASGKIEKMPCCDTPNNEPTPRPKKRKRPLQRSSESPGAARKATVLSFALRKWTS